MAASLGDHTDAFFDSFRRLQEDSPKVRIASVLGSVGQSLVNRTGGSSGPLEGAYLTGWYPVASDARWEPMRKVIHDHAFGDNRIDPADQGVQTTWIAYTVLRALIEQLDDEGSDGHHLARPAEDPGPRGPRHRHRRPDPEAALARRRHARRPGLPAHRERPW